MWRPSACRTGSTRADQTGRRNLGRHLQPHPCAGGAIVATNRTDPPSFNRIAHQAIATEIFALATQGRLIRINRETQELEPWLAEKWQASPDGKTFTLTLRDGVQWSDGTPFTSADVAFTFAALYDSRTESPVTSALLVNGKPLAVATPDARTVVVTYPEVFGPGIRLLDLLPIMPKHKLAAALAAGKFTTAWAADTPPSGPRVARTVHASPNTNPVSASIFERNPRYWRRDAQGVQLPYVDRLTIELVPAQDAELVRLQSGQSDFTQQPLRATDIEGDACAEGTRPRAAPGTRGEPGSRFADLQPAAGEVGEGSTRGVAVAQGVPPGHLARRRSRGVCEHRLPWRRRADQRAGHAGQFALVLAGVPRL